MQLTEMNYSNDAKKLGNILFSKQKRALLSVFQGRQKDLS
jgi:hypothetical protein